MSNIAIAILEKLMIGQHHNYFVLGGSNNIFADCISHDKQFIYLNKQKAFIMCIKALFYISIYLQIYHFIYLVIYLSIFLSLNLSFFKSFRGNSYMFTLSPLKTRKSDNYCYCKAVKSDNFCYDKTGRGITIGNN